MSDAVLSARMVRSVRGIFVFMVLGLCAEVVSRRSGRDFFRALEKRIFIERQTVRMGGKNVAISGEETSDYSRFACRHLGRADPCLGTKMTGKLNLRFSHCSGRFQSCPRSPPSKL
jgi:hypothetical protein